MKLFTIRSAAVLFSLGACFTACSSSDGGNPPGAKDASPASDTGTASDAAKPGDAGGSSSSGAGSSSSGGGSSSASSSGGSSGGSDAAAEASTGGCAADAGATTAVKWDFADSISPDGGPGQLLTVHVCDTVAWTNDDTVEHTVVSDSSSSFAFTIASLPAGMTGSVQFTQAGTFSYHCGIHPNMKGQITVLP